MRRNSLRVSDPVPPRQRSIYLAGSRGQLPKVPTQAQALEAAAARSMSAAAYAYVAGSAGLESTCQANLRAFDRYLLRPRMLRDVRQRQLQRTFLGHTYATPLLTCPIGVLELAHPQADRAVARACAALGVPMVFSNQASVSMEECSALMGDSPRWFQLYWSKSDELVASLLARAERCGCSALVVTLDTPLLGYRPRDLDLGHLPFLRGAGLAQYLSDPVFQAYLDEPQPQAEKPRLSLHSLKLLYDLCRNYPGPFLHNLRSGRPIRAVRQFIDIYARADLTWERLAWLRGKTRLPLILKGVLTPEDAALARQAGVDAVWVSNHGGRQVDGAGSSLQALVDIAEAEPEMPLIFDSGVRCGADALKALRLGATLVGVGRPYVYGLALAGEAGVREVLENLLCELDLQMALCGATRPEDVELQR